MLSRVPMSIMDSFRSSCEVNGGIDQGLALNLARATWLSAGLLGPWALKL